MNDKKKPEALDDADLDETSGGPAFLKIGDIDGESRLKIGDIAGESKFSYDLIGKNGIGIDANTVTGDKALQDIIKLKR